MRGRSNVQRENANSELVQELFLTLAEFYKYPTKEFYHEIASGELEKRLNELVYILYKKERKIALTELFPNYEQMKQSFVNNFIGVDGLAVPPVESLYKKWTDDPTAELAIANSKGYYMGDSALHMRHLLKESGIELPEEFANMPDHLTIILEYYSEFISKLDPKYSLQFLADHLDWLPDFSSELQELKSAKPYLYLTDILQEVVLSEKIRLQRLSNNRGE